MFSKRDATAPLDTSLLEGLSEAQRREVAPHVDRLTVEPGTVLAREAQRAHQFVVLLSGHATARAGDGGPRGVEPGTYLGAAELLSGRAWSETVRTDEASEVLVVGGPAFRWLVHEAPRLREEVLADAA